MHLLLLLPHTPVLLPACLPRTRTYAIQLPAFLHHTACHHHFYACTHLPLPFTCIDTLRALPPHHAFYHPPAACLHIMHCSLTYYCLPAHYTLCLHAYTCLPFYHCLPFYTYPHTCLPCLCPTTLPVPASTTTFAFLTLHTRLPCHLYYLPYLLLVPFPRTTSTCCPLPYTALPSAPPACAPTPSCPP